MINENSSTRVDSTEEARIQAQRIAFAPMVFQACRVLRESGLLRLVQQSAPTGITLEEAAAKKGLPHYGTRVLLEAGLGTGVFRREEDRYILTALGGWIQNDMMTRVNMDFVHEVCYRGLFHLEAAVKEGRPAGLETLGDWRTIYEGLAQLEPEARRSWLEFDHFYSDRAFPAALPLVFAARPRRLLDVGGNTGRWALQCVKHDPAVRVTIADLAPQLDLARQAISGSGFEARIDFVAIDMLNEAQALPNGYDAIWMSQFLDCFSEREIVSILQRAARALGEHGVLHVLEPLWDRQPNAAAAFCLQQVSLYFACVANGRSRMYHSADLLRCIEKGGLRVMSQHDRTGLYHTLLCCRRALS